MLKPLRSCFGYMFKCFTASASVDIWESGLEWIQCVIPWEGQWDVTECAKHGSAAVGPATALAIPWKRDKPRLRAHMCTQARVSELAPSHSCSAPGPWHSLPPAAAAPLGLNALFLGISASTELSSPSQCQHSGEGCSSGKHVGVPVVMGPYVCTSDTESFW